MPSPFHRHHRETFEVLDEPRHLVIDHPIPPALSDLQRQGVNEPLSPYVGNDIVSVAVVNHDPIAANKLLIPGEHGLVDGGVRKVGSDIRTERREKS